MLSLRKRDIPEDYPAHVFSPIFPLLTPHPALLEEFLRPFGYSVTQIPCPVVPKGEERIRVVLHSGNTEEELEEFASRLLQWVTLMQHAQEEKDKLKEAKASKSQVQFRAML